MSWFGDAISDVGDAVNTVAGVASDAAGDVLSIAEVIPGVSNAVTFFGSELQDFANTTVGTIALRAFASFVYPGLATVLGPQLAAVAFAIPGVAKGDNFSKAWLAEFLYRLEKTADIVGADAAGELVAQFQPAMDQLIAQAQANGLDVETYAQQLEAQTGASLSDLANKLGVNAQILQTAIDYAANQIGFKSLDDLETQVEKLGEQLVKQGESALFAYTEAADIVANLPSAAVQHTFDPSTGACTDPRPISTLQKAVSMTLAPSSFFANVALVHYGQKKAPPVVMRTGGVHLSPPTVTKTPAAPMMTDDHALAAKVTTAVARAPASSNLKTAGITAAIIGALGIGAKFVGYL